jgi:hypothetical protein
MTTPEENLSVAEFHLIREDMPFQNAIHSVNDDEI